MPGSPRFEDQLLGQTLAGKYRLAEIISGGSYGVVFRADHYFCGRHVRPVAVKVTRQANLTEESAPQVFSDALVLARLMSSSDQIDGTKLANLGLDPNKLAALGIDPSRLAILAQGRQHLVQIFDLGLLPEHSNRAYMVMEYVDGSPLLSHMRAAGQLSVAAGLRFLKQVCLALAFLHGQGAVHRDIIPSNILVDHRGLVRLVDFGLAAFTDNRLGFVPGVEGLVYAYTAPETLLGRATPASDVYSLGLVMYELFTGGGPHLSARWLTEGDERGNGNYRLKTGLRFEPPSHRQNEIRNDYRWLDALLLRCLEPNPEERFANAAQLLLAVETSEAGLDLPEASLEEEIEADPEETRPAPAADLSEDAEALFREVRKLLAGKAYDQVIDRLDVHRPAEWAVLDLTGARTLRALGQAYLCRGDTPTARDCLEQLRSQQRRQALLPRGEYAAALSDLIKCYRKLGLTEQAQACQDEARSL